ncbi:MAG: lysostaphin resistance A-like protein [Thermoplasmata archaeon]
MALSEVRQAPAFSLEKGPLLSLLAYLGAVVGAEILAAIATEANPDPLLWGMTIHIVLLFALLGHGASLAKTDVRLSRLLIVLSLVPLIRILSLGLPSTQFTVIQWLLLIAMPLLAAAIVMMFVLAIPPREAYLRLGSPAHLPWQAGVAVSGFGLGAVEYFLLAEGAWVDAFVLELILPAAIVIGLASGLAEELIFRGLLQPQTERVVGPASGLLFVALLFAAMHIGFYDATNPLTALDLPFVFAVGLYFGFVVQRTRSLVGVIFAHGLANVTLYLLMPFAF